MQKDKKQYYLSGEEILIGDRIKLGESEGKIVFVLDSEQFSPKYPKQEWEYLKKGIGIETEQYGLIHEEVPDEDLILIKREKST